ncbi:MAG: ATP-binding protein [Bacteroidetes bacterium]|nr:ATP-binding protein [Bacteroidota bacterium]
MKENPVGKFDHPDHPPSEGRPMADETGQRHWEDQLLQSQRLEALGTLVGGIAHDFNNILNVITGHVSLMERWRENPERFAKSFDAVKKATDRGAQTARQLLTFSRKAEVVTEHVKIGDVIEELTDLLREIFPEKIHFSIKIEPDIPIILADSNRIHQALLNLCMNARDAMPLSGTIAISAKGIGRAALNGRFRGAEADRYVQVEVSDSGSGIKKEELGHIFEPFFTTKRNGRGTGLGLSVVDWIMKAHNGFVDVESRVGTGTVFSLYFPVLPQTAGVLSGEKDRVESPKGGGEVILAIEDEEPLRDFLKTILEESGYRVLLASDGTEGLQTYMEHLNDIALVLLDMGLPEMSGAEVLAKLVLLNPQVRVISASGYVQPEVKADAFETGALDFLPKPYLVDELLMRVHRALRADAETTT